MHLSAPFEPGHFRRARVGLQTKMKEGDQGSGKDAFQEEYENAPLCLNTRQRKKKEKKDLTGTGLTLSF